MQGAKENLYGPKRRRLFTCRDLGLSLFLLFLAAGGWLLQARLSLAPVAVVRLASGEAFTVDLTQNQELSIPGRLGSLTAVVVDGTIRITAAGCPDQICVNSGRLPSETMAIICVPNGVLITAVQERARYDAVTW
ncbi:MAG: hypothetical protein GX058_00660 [Firmicutes bacterium]|nr:hypothetical protein [Bacillota bacterium]